MVMKQPKNNKVVEAPKTITKPKGVKQLNKDVRKGARSKAAGGYNA